MKLTAKDHEELEAALAYKDWTAHADVHNDEKPLRIQASWRTGDGQPVGMVLMLIEGDTVEFADLSLMEPYRYQGLYTSLWDEDGLRGWLLARGVKHATLGNQDPAMRAWWTRRGFRKIDPNGHRMRVGLERRPTG